MYDLTIIGAGPGGYHTAIRAAQKGLKVALIEKNKVGGVCLNVGCIPTKALYGTAHRLIQINEENEAFGIKSKNTVFDFTQAQKRKDEVVENMTSSVEALLKKHGVDLKYGEAEFLDKNNIKVNDNIINTKNTIIATGSSPLMLPFFNIDHKVILDSTDLLNIEKLPKSLIILGAGVMGIEFASIFNAFGVKVTILELEKQILPSVDKIIASQMSKILKSRGIDIFLKKKTTIIRNDNGEAYFQLEDGSKFRAEKALISIGRKFNSDIIGLDDLGINKTKNNAITVDKFQKTNIDNIYAIGDVVGGMLLAHVASYEGEKALAKILSYTYPDSVIPAAIFSIPEIATVGEKTKKKGMFSYQASGKAMAIGEEKGLALFYADENDKITGSTIMGADASNLIQLITLAINNNMTVDNFVKNVFPHPTLSEIVLEGVEDIHGMAIHKYGKRK